MVKERLRKTTDKLFDFSNVSHVSTSIVLQKFRLSTTLTPTFLHLYVSYPPPYLNFLFIASNLYCYSPPSQLSWSNIRYCPSLQDNTPSLPFMTSAVFSSVARTHFSLLTSQVTGSHKNLIFVPSLYIRMYVCLLDSDSLTKRNYALCIMYSATQLMGQVILLAPELGTEVQGDSLVKEDICLEWGQTKIKFMFCLEFLWLPHSSPASRTKKPLQLPFLHPHPQDLQLL